MQILKLKGIDIKAHIAAIGGIEAVSYTHLDVYKRQERGFLSGLT